MLPIPFIIAGAAVGAAAIRHFKNKSPQKRVKGDELFSLIRNYKPEDRLYTDAILKMIQLCEDVNVHDEEGRTPLMYAVSLSSKKLIEVLLKQGADVHALDKMGRSAVFYASSVDVLTQLVKHGAICSVVDADGRTPLFYASECDKAAIQFMFEHGVDWRARDKDGRTALFFAQSEVLAGFLISRGLDISVRDNTGMLAVEFNTKESIRNYINSIMNDLLIEEIVKFARLSDDYEVFENYVGDGDIRGKENCLLDRAIEKGAFRFARYLIELGPFKLGRKSSDLYIKALKSGNVEAAECLLAGGQDGDIFVDGKRAIWVAIDNNDMPMVRLLAQYGVDLTCRRLMRGDGEVFEGSDPIEYALHNNNSELFIILIEAGVGRDPQMLQDEALVAKIRKSGALFWKIYMNACTDVDRGWLLKNEYCKNSIQGMISYLEKGVDPISVNTIMLNAISSGKANIVELLLSHGADPDLGIPMAEVMRNEEILRILRKYKRT